MRETSENEAGRRHTESPKSETPAVARGRDVKALLRDIPRGRDWRADLDGMRATLNAKEPRRND
jgi:hypothetical protein